MTTLQAIVAGEVFDLSDRVRRFHLGHDGFGLPPVDLFEEQGPQQHGTSFTFFRMAPRVVQLDLLTAGSDDDDYWTSRAELEYIFAPRDAALSLRFSYQTAGGVDQVRQLDCRYMSGLSLPSSDRLGDVAHRAKVTLKANNPFFYDPTLASLSFQLAGGSGSFSVPLAIPWNIGSSTLDQTTSLVYPGTWDTFPLIDIYGPIVSPKMVNNSTGDFLDFTGITINAGDRYTIDTRYGYKRVYKNGVVTDNRINELTQASSLATFRLARKPDAAGGVNDLRVTGTGVTTATQVYMSYYVQYLGL